MTARSGSERRRAAHQTRKWGTWVPKVSLTQEEAEWMASDMSVRLGRGHEAYKCWCRAWHVGQPPAEAKRRSKRQVRENDYVLLFDDRTALALLLENTKPREERLRSLVKRERHGRLLRARQIFTHDEMRDYALRAWGRSA